MVRLNLTEVRWQLVNEERDKSLVNFKSYKQKKEKISMVVIESAVGLFFVCKSSCDLYQDCMESKHC